jgi:hypothetical protein
MDIQPDPYLPENRWRTRSRLWIDPAVWIRDDMRRALARRDIATVYRILQRHGVAQRKIAALTDQSQSEVSEIVAGKRRVVAYDLLTRIADGFAIPRGWMGLASDDDPPSRPDASQP